MMILFYNGLKSLHQISGKAVSVNTLNYLGFGSTVRLCSTANFVEKETKAVAKIKVRRLRGASSRIRYDFGSWVLLVIPVSSFALGVWQVFRKFEKDEINDKLLEKANRPTTELPENLEELKDMEFCSVRVRGRFDHSREIYMGPRPLITEQSLTQPLSLLSNTKAGYLVVTPFKLSDRDLTILVNRGWVPSKKKLPYIRPEGQISEEVELTGLVRNNEIRKPLGAKNNIEKKQWVYRDLYKMAEITGAAPVFIDADKKSSVPGGPIGGQTIKQFPNDHLSYLVTWFSLSGVSGYMWYLRHLQKIPIPV